MRIGSPRSALRGLAALSVALLAGLPAPAGLPAEKVRRVEALLSAEMSRQGIPGLSAAIAVDARLAWSNGFGLADVENNVPAKAVTVYRTASVGKSITAVAAVQLAERGKLDLDAPVQRYCPSFPEKRWPLTARHLLSHLGGVRHYGDDPAEFFSTRHYDGVGEALELFRDDPLVAEPGSRYLYSSYGFNLLGCVIEGAAGEPFLDYLRGSIFEPAGMRRTRDDDPLAIIPDRARGYTRGDDGELRNSRFVDMSNKLPAGGFVTTAEDLVRFAAALLRGELVSAEGREAMFTPQRTSGGERVDYGLGWGLSPPDDLWYGEREVYHGGGTPMVSTMLYMLPGRGFAVAIMANLEGVEDRVGLCARIARVVLDLGAGPAP